MGSSSQWKAVTFSSVTPQLLIKTRFDRTGYHIQLTDLSRIWEESLSKEDVIKRAAEDACSFNPGDDDGNYDAFLKCIKSALNGEPKTSSNLRAGESERLSLDLSTPLSGGLPDLKWTVKFDKLSEAAVATEIVGPLLLQANSLQHQIQQLVDELSSKDHVIQKITDSLHTSGTDLTAIFPGVSNIKTSRKRTQSQRSQFAGHVKGLADFDEIAWKAAHHDLSEGQELTPDMMDTILRDLPPPQLDEKPFRNWVQGLASGSSESQGRSQVPSRTKNLKEAPTVSRQETQDEDFQRQETPPHLSRKTATREVTAARDEIAKSAQPARTAKPASPEQNGDDSETETEDEDCLDIPPTTSQQQAVSTIEPAGHTGEEDDQDPDRPQTRSGDVEKARSPPYDLDMETDDPASSPPITKSQVKAEKHDTESEAEPEKKPRRGGLGKFGGAKAKNDPPAEEPQKEAETSPAKPKGRLGKFGGKKAQSPEPTPEPVVSTSKPKSTLGRFGGKAKSVSTAPSSAEEARDDEKDVPVDSGTKTAFSRRLATEEEPAPERELTEEEKQQRANEKREKLKRELEEKAAKGPVKKKRKF